MDTDEYIRHLQTEKPRPDGNLYSDAMSLSHHSSQNNESSFRKRDIKQASKFTNESAPPGDAKAIATETDSSLARQEPVVMVDSLDNKSNHSDNHHQMKTVNQDHLMTLVEDSAAKHEKPHSSPQKHEPPTPEAEKVETEPAAIPAEAPTPMETSVTHNQEIQPQEAVTKKPEQKSFDEAALREFALQVERQIIEKHERNKQSEPLSTEGGAPEGGAGILDMIKLFSQASPDMLAQL